MLGGAPVTHEGEGLGLTAGVERHDRLDAPTWLPSTLTVNCALPWYGSPLTWSTRELVPEPTVIAGGGDQAGGVHDLEVGPVTTVCSRARSALFQRGSGTPARKKFDPLSIRIIP